MMPLLWGDSFGEIIGSFFGKITFEVRGLGDVNTKTVEGTVAVFASSFIAQIVMYYYIFALPPLRHSAESSPLLSSDFFI